MSNTSMKVDNDVVKHNAKCKPAGGVIMTVKESMLGMLTRSMLPY